MNKAQLYLGNDLLDFNDEVNIKLQCYDMRSTEIGNSNKSYTINIPLTRDNTNFLEHGHLINSRKQITQRMRLILGGIELIRGLPRVLGINTTSIKVIIDSDDWVDGIAGVSLRDLSWVGGDQHEFNATNIENSWGAGSGALYRYPLINFAELFTEETGDDSGIIPNDFVAMWNISQIVTKIFNDAGYALATGFFDDAATKAFYILSEEQVADEDFIVNKAMDVYVDDNADNYDEALAVGNTGIANLTVDQVLDIDGETIDEGDDFFPGDNKYVIPETGTYRFEAQVKIFSTPNNDHGDWGVTHNSISWSIRKDIATVLASFSLTDEVAVVDTFDPGNVFNLDTGWVYCEVGEDIDIDINLGVVAENTSGGPLDAFLYVINGATISHFNNTWDNRNLYKGVLSTMDPAVHLPDIDSLDFLKALREIFNLRFWFDQYNKTIHIESDPDFVGSTVIDWSDKIDLSQATDQEIIAVSYFKNQVWQYAPDDTDKAYTNHVAENGIPFTKELVLTNASTKPGTDTRINSIFSPTVKGNMPQIGHFLGDIIRLFGGDDFVAGKSYPAYRAKKWFPRILNWVSGTSTLDSSGSWEWFESMQDFLEGTSTNKTTFPEAETLDYSDAFDDYWSRAFHFVDGSRALTATLVFNPTDLMAFITVVGTAANEGFRATYKLNIQDTDMYFYITQIISDASQGIVTAIQKM